MIASPDAAAPTPALEPVRDAARKQDAYKMSWAHALVLDIIEANLPLPALAKHLKIPFETLLAHLNSPEVQAEINAYEAIVNLRARLIGQTARPISIRKMLEVLETPTPRALGRNPEADQRTLHRHAELIRRTATSIARESRALNPAPRPTPPSRTSSPNKPPTSDTTSPAKPPAKPDPEAAKHDAPARDAQARKAQTHDASTSETVTQHRAADDTAHGGTALGGTAPGDTALQSGANHLNNGSLQSGVNHPDIAAHNDSLHTSDNRASPLLAAAGSARARDHPCA